MSEHRRTRLFGAGAAFLGALFFPVFLSVIYGARPAITFRSSADLHALADGFYTVETSEAGTFVWTRPHAELLLWGLDRRVDWRLTGKVMAWRPEGVPLPNLRIAIDDVVGLDEIVADGVSLDIPLPRRAGSTGATLTFDTAPGFVPSPEDPREIGIAIESMSIAPTGTGGRPLPPARARAGGTIALFAIGATLVALRFPPLFILGGLVLTAWSQAWLMTRGLIPYMRYPLQAAEVALGLGLGTLLTVWILERIRGRTFETAARGLVAFSLTVCYLKLLVLLHPAMQIGDGIFHAHRLEYVLGGRFYFTSVDPGGYAFPYPILLYLVAAPFSWWAPDAMDQVALLRIVVTVADATAGAMLYWMVMRATSERLVAVTSVVWYHLVLMTAWIMTWGNLTNAFGQTLFVTSLAMVVAVPVEWTRRRSVALLALVAAAAMLSHPSTCAILGVVLAVTAILYRWRGGQDLQPAAYGVACAAGLAAITAFVLYYAWFPEIYMHELNRVGAEAGVRAAAPVSAFGSRLALVPELAARYFGWPAVIVSGVGAWRVGRKDVPLRLRLLLLAWVGTCILFLLLGVLTPVDMRYHFTGFPALALMAAWGWSWAWRGGLPIRVAATLTLSAAAWVGVQQWTAMLP